MSVHTVLAAFGLSLLIAHSPVAFVALKIIGGGYLLYLGISTIRSPHRLHTATSSNASLPYLQISRQATIVNLLNPKIIVFYIAFLPQFVQRHAAPVTAQMLLLGGLFVVMGFATDATIGVLSARLTNRLTSDTQLGARVGYACGTILCLLAVVLLAGI
jgi:threonine/homoserine/homoserine lactone efflux protein